MITNADKVLKIEFKILAGTSDAHGDATKTLSFLKQEWFIRFCIKRIEVYEMTECYLNFVRVIRSSNY